MLQKHSAQRQEGASTKSSYYISCHRYAERSVPGTTHERQSSSDSRAAAVAPAEQQLLLAVVASSLGHFDFAQSSRHSLRVCCFKRAVVSSLLSTQGFGCQLHSAWHVLARNPEGGLLAACPPHTPSKGCCWACSVCIRVTLNIPRSSSHTVPDTAASQLAGFANSFPPVVRFHLLQPLFAVTVVDYSCVQQLIGDVQQ